MNDVERFAKMKRSLVNAQREADKAQGAHASVMKRLKEEYGCDTVEEAQAKLRQLVADEEQTATAFKRSLDLFQKRWGKRLGL